MAVPPIGARVRVPVGTRTLTGCVVEHDALIEEGTDAKNIVEALDREPLLPASVVELCRWVAEYYVAGIGDALAVAMPPGARATKSAFKQRRVAIVTIAGSESGGEATHPDDTPGESTQHLTLTRTQRSALSILSAAQAGLPTSELRERGVTAAVLTGLVKRGLVAFRDERD